MPKLTLSYYPDITQKQTPDAVRSSIIVFAEALARELSDNLKTPIEIEVLPVMSVPQQHEAMLARRTHIGLLKPVAYIFAHRRVPSVLPACVAHRPIDGVVGTFYFGQLYARKELGIDSVKALARREPGTLRIAYGDRFSTSNFLIPASLMRVQEGIHPFMFFKEVLFAGGHDLAAEAVYRGDADIGAGHDGVIKILGEQFPDAEQKLVRIGKENIHSDPVVVRTDILPEPVTLQAIQNACTQVAKTPPVKEALDLFWGWVKDLSPTKHENYASIERALEALKLEETDMLR
jgi:phosphonate transport system substrate-binding protein